MSTLECQNGSMSLRHAALGLIARTPSSGYDLLRTFSESLAFVWPATQSQLYTELNRLHSDGLLTVDSTGPRGRKSYRITEEGRAELTSWLATPPRSEVRSADLLQIFLLSEVPRSQARRHLAALARSAQDEVTELESARKQIDWDDSSADEFARIVLEYGIRMRHAQVESLRWASSQISGPRNRVDHEAARRDGRSPER